MNFHGTPPSPARPGLPDRAQFQILGALPQPQGAIMATKAPAIPKGFHTITPSLIVAQASKVIDFYKKALGAEEVMRFPGPDGRIMYAELRIGDSPLMLGDEMAEQGMKGPKSYGGT